MQSISARERAQAAGEKRAVTPTGGVRKTIWIVNQYAGSKYHGMVFRHYYLGREFVKHGCRVYVISASYTHLQWKHPTVSGPFTTEHIDGIDYCWVRVPAYEKSTTIRRALNMLAFAYRLRQLNADEFAAPDVVILSSPSPFPLLTVRSWCKKFNARLIFEIRDIWPLSLIEIAGVPRLHPFVILTGWFERMAYRYADYVVSVLPDIREYTKRFHVPDHRVHYIPNGVSIDDRDAACEGSSAASAAIPEHGFVVGYAGALSVANSLQYFVQAADLLRHRTDIFFVILGDGSLKDELKRMASHLPNVIFIDAVSKSCIPGLIARFDLCYAGRGDQAVYRFGVSPNKVFDYMLAAKPILHSTSTLHDPVCYSGCGRSIPPENPRAIAEAIEEFSVLSLDERKAIGKKGHEFVLRHHVYGKLAEAYLRLFV